MLISSVFLPDMRQLPPDYTAQKVMRVGGVCCLCQKQGQSYQVERILSTNLQDYLHEDRFLHRFFID